MTQETLKTRVEQDTSSWPFSENMDYNAVLLVASEALRIHEEQGQSLPTSVAIALIDFRLNMSSEIAETSSTPDANERRSAISHYKHFLLSIPATESTIAEGLPLDPNTHENTLDQLNFSMSQKADLFLDLVRKTGLLIEDNTAIQLLQTTIWQNVLRVAGNNQGKPLNRMLNEGAITCIGDLQNPQCSSVLPPSIRGQLKALQEYRKIYRIASASRHPEA